MVYTRNIMRNKCPTTNSSGDSLATKASKPLSRRPFLKWAGGKTQLLGELTRHCPKTYGKYIEPFLGAGALFFHLRPKQAVLSDSNEELINCYTMVRDDVEPVIEGLLKCHNTEKYFYQMRALDCSTMTAVERAVRFIYLNKTCFNGLYRVNKDGQFNVPFGRRINPLICDTDTLRNASHHLQGVTLVCGDYKDVLKKYACSGDFVFMDPPYYPVGGFADFQRYTKEQFHEEDHVELRDEFARLNSSGVWVLLTNSAADFVLSLYDGYKQIIVDTKRIISSSASSRKGQDLIVIGTRPPTRKPSHYTVDGSTLLEHFPGTRFMGSKYKVLPFLWECLQGLKFNSALDAFSGSGCVSYMLKQMGKEVISNDFMNFCYRITHSLVENPRTRISDEDLSSLLAPNPQASDFISRTFQGLYFSDQENRFLDCVRGNINALSNKYKKSLALASLARACMKRRARGIFTYIGDRYDDGRKDMKMDLQEHFIENIEAFNNAVFDNGKKCRAFNGDVFDIKEYADLVYFDPPYFSKCSDNDYTRRYHFVEGLVREWKGLDIQWETQTRKFKRYETPFMREDSAYEAFERLFEQHRKSIIVVSYSSNSLPTKDDLTAMLKNQKKHVEVRQIDHTYSFGNQGHTVADNANRVLEYVFIAV